MVRIVMMLLLLLPFPALADGCKPKAWWETAFPGSYEPSSMEQSGEDSIYEYGNDSEYLNDSSGSPEPEVYHWDNLYLEPNYPEIIVNPYGNSDNYDY